MSRRPESDARTRSSSKSSEWVAETVPGQKFCISLKRGLSENRCRVDC